MSRFILWRLWSVIPIFFGVSVVGFLLMKMVPGDPTFYLLGPWAGPEAREALLKKLGWDQPLPVQYYKWLINFVQGDFGTSTTYDAPVSTILLERVVNSGILTGISFAIASVLGFGGGIIAAIKQYSVIDRAITATAIALASAPVYWLGLLLVFFFGLLLGVLPVSSMYSLDREGEILDLLRHAILPAFTTALIPMAVIIRLTRSAMADALGQAYVQAARARGLSERSVILRHATKNILAPIVNITGLQLGFIFGAALFSEVVFNWPGIGLLIFDAIGTRDVPVIQTVVIFNGALFVTINLITDITQALIDPRTKGH
ncbi:MAG: ABC transporter permease [Rhodospirillaceae bacterium]|nr:ABC transporter permease [Rhodospirillaceae bacterium]